MERTYLPEAAQSATSTGSKLRRKLIVWAIYSVGVAVLPLACNALSLSTRNQPVTYTGLLGRGELLLISAALAAAAAGELIASKTRLHDTRLVLAGLNLVIVIVSSYWFGDLAAAQSAQTAVNHGLITNGSTLILLFTLISTGSSVVVAELSQ